MSVLERMSALLPDTAGVSEKGHLILGGCDVVGLATEFGLKDVTGSAKQLSSAVEKNLDALLPWYWNTGQERDGAVETKLAAAGLGAGKTALMPPLTHTGRYRKEIREVGTGRFRVR